MSFVTTIDTLQFSNRMQKAGFEKKAADELAEAIKETQSQSLENVATKQDVELLRISTKQDIKDVKQEVDLLRKDVQHMEQKIINRVGTMMTIAVGILVAVIKL